MIDLQDTDKSCHIVLTEFKYHLITKFVLSNSLIAQRNDLPFFIQELGRSYIIIFLRQNSFRQYYT